MNVLLVYQSFIEKDEGGGIRFNEMLRFWESQGHSTTVLAGMIHHYTGNKPEQYKGKYTYTDHYSDKITVIRCHTAKAYSKGFLGRLGGYFSFVFSSIYAGLFKAKGSFDLLLVTSPPLFVAISAIVISRLRRIPMVFEVRDLWPESAIDTGVVNNKWLIRFSYWFERQVYRMSKRINVLTPAFRDALIAKGVPPEKIFFIPNAADFSVAEKSLEHFDRQTFRAEQGWTDKFVALYVGAHGRANHLIQLLDVAEKLKHEEKIRICLVGDGMEKEMLVENAQKRGLNNVQFVPYLPKSEIFKWIKAADVGVACLKKVDTFKTIYSNKTFDYMSCRIPILMCIDGVSRALVEESGCGIFAEPENIETITETLVNFKNTDATTLQEMGERGYQYARQHFDRALLADRYVEELQKV